MSVPNANDINSLNLLHHARRTLIETEVVANETSANLSSQREQMNKIHAKNCRVQEELGLADRFLKRLKSFFK